MDSKLQSVIERVRKLQALSTSSNIHESIAATAAANKLIDQYRLEESDFSIDNGELDPIEEDSNYIYESGRITQWKASLIRVLANHYGVAYFNDISRKDGRKVSRYKLIGKRTDLQIVNYMYTWLTMECIRLSDKEAKGSGRVFVASYQDGFVAGINDQLRASRIEIEAKASGEAIIKLNSRLVESQNFMYSKYRLVSSKATNSSQKNGMAYSLGQDRGKNIHLGSSLGSGSLGGPRLLNK